MKVKLLRKLRDKACKGFGKCDTALRCRLLRDMMDARGWYFREKYSWYTRKWKMNPYYKKVADTAVAPSIRSQRNRDDQSINTVLLMNAIDMSMSL